MRKLLFRMLKKYSRTEKGRLEILRVLHDSVGEEYCEQTGFGNVYNANIEFIMANTFTVNLVKNDDTKSLEMIKSNLDSSFDEAIKIIKKEKIK